MVTLQNLSHERGHLNYIHIKSVAYICSGDFITFLRVAAPSPCLCLSLGVNLSPSGEWGPELRAVFSVSGGVHGASRVSATCSQRAPLLGIMLQAVKTPQHLILHRRALGAHGWHRPVYFKVFLNPAPQHQ